MKTLVIFNLIPEQQLTAIVDMTQEEFNYFSQAHNYITNISDWDENKVEIVGVVNNALCKNADYIQYCENEKEREYFMKWEQEKTIPTDLTNVDKLLVFGFHL